MRASRAYLAGFGTAGSLLAGAAIAFLVASAVVAFRGWPQIGGQTPVANLTPAPRPGPATSAVSRRLIAAVATPTGAAPQGAGGPSVAARPGRSSAPSSTALQSQPTSSSPGTTTTTTTGTTGPTGPSCGTCGAPSGGPPAPGSTLGTVLEGATGALGKTVSSTGQSLGSTVRTLAGTVADRLSGTSLSSTVSSAGDTTGGAVSSVGSAAGSVVSGAGNSLGGLSKP